MAFALAASSRGMEFNADFKDNLDMRSKLRRGRPALALISALLAGMGLVAARESVVRLAPRTGVLFAALGMPVNLTGLEIGRVSARIIMDNGRRVLVVDGDVGNISVTQQAIPALQVSIRSGAGAPLYVWSTRPPRQKLGSGERAAFSARLASPPGEAVDVIVAFDQTAPKPAPTPTSSSKTISPKGKAGA